MARYQPPNIIIIIIIIIRGVPNYWQQSVAADSQSVYGPTPITLRSLESISLTDQTMIQDSISILNALFWCYISVH